MTNKKTEGKPSYRTAREIKKEAKVSVSMEKETADMQKKVAKELEKSAIAEAHSWLMEIFFYLYTFPASYEASWLESGYHP